MRRLAATFITLLATCFLAQPPRAQATDYDNSPTVGPARGWLVISGGGGAPPEVDRLFVTLAGGPNANFVMIPTAMSDAEINPDTIRQSYLKRFGVTHVTVLHTRDRVRANSEGFVEPLRHASGVWIDGGRQWRLADAYLGTAVEREIKSLLARGGVVDGGSAGATIQGSYLVRGAPEGNEIMMAPGHEVGFGLLPNSAIDQHVNTRGREKDLDSVVSVHPELLGIGIDEHTAIVVHGDSFRVVGVGQVAIHDGKDHDGALYYFLSSGQTFNLKTRAVAVQADSLSIPKSSPADNSGLTFAGHELIRLTVISSRRYNQRGSVRSEILAILSDSGSGPVAMNCEGSGGLLGQKTDGTPGRYLFYHSKPNQIKIVSRTMGSETMKDNITCKY